MALSPREKRQKRGGRGGVQLLHRIAAVRIPSAYTAALKGYKGIQGLQRGTRGSGRPLAGRQGTPGGQEGVLGVLTGEVVGPPVSVQVLVTRLCQKRVERFWQSCRCVPFLVLNPPVKPRVCLQPPRLQPPRRDPPAPAVPWCRGGRRRGRLAGQQERGGSRLSISENEVNPNEAHCRRDFGRHLPAQNGEAQMHQSADGPGKGRASKSLHGSAPPRQKVDYPIATDAQGWRGGRRSQPPVLYPAVVAVGTAVLGALHAAFVAAQVAED